MAANNFTYWNEIWETNVEVGNNRSIIHCKVHLKANGRGWQSSRSFSGNVNIGGNNHSFSWSPGNGSFPYASYNERVIAEFSDWIGHGQDGSLSVGVSSSYSTSGGYSPGYCSDSDTFYGYKIPRQANITGAESFNDEQSPTIWYSNPAGGYASGLDTCISWTGGDDIKYRALDKNGSSYKYNFTSAERETLRKACANVNSKNMRFYVRTEIGGNTFYSTTDRTLTIINANPTVNPTVVDTNQTIINLTGNANTLVRYESNAKAVMNPSTKKFATISENTISNSGVVSKNSSNTFNKISSGKFEFYLRDSRGNVVTKTVEKTMINYLMPTCNITAKNPILDAGTNTARTSIRFQGDCFKGSFGKVANTVLLQYRRKTGYGDYGNWETIPVTVRDDNTYDTEIQVKGLNYKDSYTFQARITDKLHTVESKEKRVKTTPIFEWDDDTFNVNGSLCVNGSPIGDGLPIGAMIPFGSENNVPTNWRVCDGSAVSRTAYKQLFEVIGTSYGAGDGRTTFNLPDKRGRVSVGKDGSTEFNKVGTKGGEKRHAHKYGYAFAEYYGDTYMKDEQALHNTGIYDGDTGGWKHPERNGEIWTHRNGGATTSSVGTNMSRMSAIAHTSYTVSMPPYEVDIWIIKVSNNDSDLINKTEGKIIDNLTSTSTTDALSANMGKELNDKNVYDFGSNSNGSWIRFNNGIMICSHTKDFGNVWITSAWGSFYESGQLTFEPFPIPFKYSPNYTIMPNGSFYIESEGGRNEKTIGHFYATRPNSYNGYPVTCSYIAVGWWK